MKDHGASSGLPKVAQEQHRSKSYLPTADPLEWSQNQCGGGVEVHSTDAMHVTGTFAE